MNKAIFLVLLVICSAYAWRRGGAPERAAAFVLIVATLLTIVVASSPLVLFQSLETGIFVVDVAAFLALGAIGLFAARSWPMLMAALQLVTIFAHVAAFMNVTLPWAYAFMLSVWSYPMLLLLVIGSWRHARRVRRHRSGFGPSIIDWVPHVAIKRATD